VTSPLNGVFPDSPELTGRIGGSLGKRARVGGIWYDPVPWTIGAALVSWLIGMLRQVPCIQSNPEEAINPIPRLCYSDIGVLYASQSALHGGGSVWAENSASDYPPLIGYLITFVRWISKLLGAKVEPGVTGTDLLHATNMFFALNAILLFGCFVALIIIHLRLGAKVAVKHTQGIQLRAWDAVFIALSPAIMTAALINWDLWAVMLVSLVLLLWARRKPLAAGVVAGVACATKFYPLALIPVLLLLCVRAGKGRAFLTFFGGGIASWLILNLPLLFTDKAAWLAFYTHNAARGAELGSIWYVLQLAGVKWSGPLLVSALMIAGIAIGGVFIIMEVLDAPRRPRVPQVMLLVLVIFLVFNKVYSPQYVLWLLPFVVLARPKLLDVAVWSTAELAYFFAIWGFLGGVLGPGTGADRLYWLIVMLRILVQFWVFGRVIHDIRNPWDDPVRVPYVDDPVGGILDHESDASWVQPRRARAAGLPVAKAHNKEPHHTDGSELGNNFVASSSGADVKLTDRSPELPRLASNTMLLSDEE
jgi:hypothetical protein